MMFGSENRSEEEEEQETMFSLVGGFNPFEKYSSNWIISSGRGENKKYLKPPPSMFSGTSKTDFQTSFRLSFTTLDSHGAELLHGATALVAVIHQFLHLKHAIHQIPKFHGS